MEEQNRNEALTEEAAAEWMPPELVARAQQTAERDAGTGGAAGTAAAKQGRRKKGSFGISPQGKNKRYSAALAILELMALTAMAVLYYVGPFAADELARTGPLGRSLRLLWTVVYIALILVMLLPIARGGRYRMLMILLCGLATVLPFAYSISVARHAPAEDNAMLSPMATAVTGSLFTMIISAPPWMFLGALRRKSSEKVAALFLSIAVGITLLGLLMVLIARLTGMESTLSVTALSGFEVVHSLCLVLLLRSWPVVTRPVLAKVVTQVAAE